MTNAVTPSWAVSTIAEMITPALLILGSASLVASALVRMARVVDRARTLSVIVCDGSWKRNGITVAELRRSLERHAARARYAERSIALLYTAVVLFVATCLLIAVDRAAGHALGWAPMALAVLGTVVLLGGGAWMVAECRLSGAQIAEEIREALLRLEEGS
jgi:hypothetical protein